MKKLIAMLCITVFLAFSLTACRVEKTQEGEMPEVEVEVKTEEGQLPKYDVDAPDVDIETKEVTVEVPDIQVTTPDDPNYEEEKDDGQ